MPSGWTEYEGTSPDRHGLDTPRMTRASQSVWKREVIGQITHGEIIRIDVDLAKWVIQAHAVNAMGRVVANKTPARDKFTRWCAQLPPGCLIAKEACGGAHRRARQFQAHGHTVRLMAPKRVTPYRMSGGRGKHAEPGRGAS